VGSGYPALFKHPLEWTCGICCRVVGITPEGIAVTHPERMVTSAEERHEFVVCNVMGCGVCGRCQWHDGKGYACGKPASDPVHESARPTEDQKKVIRCEHWPSCGGLLDGCPKCKAMQPTLPPDEYAVLSMGGVSEDAVDVAARAGQAERCACGHTDRQHGLPRMVDNGPLWRACAECRCNEYRATEPQEPGEGE
jgi:hypothetical protein